LTDIISKEEDALLKLLEVGDVVPEREIFIRRLGIKIKVKALKSNEVYEIRERAIIRNERKGTERLDIERFNVALIKKATISPDWSDKRLLEKYNVLSGEDVIRKVLLAGEIIEIADIILDLSGFNEEFEEVKNS